MDLLGLTGDFPGMTTDLRDQCGRAPFPDQRAVAPTASRSINKRSS